MDLSLSELPDGRVELIVHGLRPTELMQILAGSITRGKGLVKHLEISEHEGIDGVLARGDFPHEVVAPGCWLFDANVAVTFLSNVHMRKGELTVLADFPGEGPARAELLGPGELYPDRFRAHGGIFYAVTPNEDLVSVATTDPALARRILIQAAKAVALGRITMDPLEGEEALFDVLAPLARDPALHLRRRRGDYPGEKHAAALGHATPWIRRLVRSRLRQRQATYRYPSQVVQHEIVVVPNANRVTVSEPRTIPLHSFFGLNRWLFDRFGPAYFLALIALLLGALCPAVTMLTTGPSPSGVVGVALLLVAGYALGDVAARE